MMRLVFFIMAVAAVLAAFLLTLPPRQVEHAKSYGEARIGGAFLLTDTHGHLVSDHDFRGRLMLVYMGYSRCPDICPMTLTTMSTAETLLKEDAKKVSMLFISLDPEHDTPQALAGYLAAFDPRIIGLTGSKKAVQEAAQAYKIFYKKTDGPVGSAPTIDHSGFLYLMNARGKYVTHFDVGVKPEALVKTIQAQF